MRYQSIFTKPHVKLPPLPPLFLFAPFEIHELKINHFSCLIVFDKLSSFNEIKKDDIKIVDTGCSGNIFRLRGSPYSSGGAVLATSWKNFDNY